MSDTTRPRSRLSIEDSASTTGVRPLLLSTVPHLADLDDEARQRLAACTEARLLRPGRVIFWQGELAADVFVLLDGRVMLRHRAPAALPHLHGQEVRVSGTFGDALLLGDAERYETASAVDVTLVLRVPWKPLDEALAARPEIRDRWTDEILLRVYRNGASSLRGADAA